MLKQLVLNLFRRKRDNGSYRLNGKFVTFLICLFLSVFFWFITIFSKEYTTSVNFPVVYLNVPKTKVMMNRLPSTIDVDVTAGGFTILYYKLTNGIPIRIDVKEAKPFPGNEQYYIAVGSKIEKMGRQFGNNIRFIRVSPDTLFIDYRKRVIKSVPVKLNLDVTYEKEYELNDSIRANPTYITLSGPEEIISKVKYVETEKTKLADVDGEVQENIALKLPYDTSIVNFSATEVNVTIRVTKYTEGTLELPVEVENLPKGSKIKLFPAKVTVKYSVPFEDFEKVDASSFRIKVEYVKKLFGKKLKVEIVKKPANVRSVRISPEKVEFIIHK